MPSLDAATAQICICEAVHYATHQFRNLECGPAACVVADDFRTLAPEALFFFTLGIDAASGHHPGALLVAFQPLHMRN